ncbi:PHD finger protein 11 [Cichlidogyrus casuarinus]|uniref:PHD finger protein 11 n=1 Tax=Cichlidogyrus casuarinus TaxID=1844966 RepID=A0ABD2Q482_9PLAT
MQKNSLFGETDIDLYKFVLYDIIHGRCCQGSWFHRKCIQKYAISAGLHHVKCPMCSNIDSFIKRLIEVGIWIPDKDASWELEPDAFQELYSCPVSAELAFSVDSWEPQFLEAVVIDPVPLFEIKK